LGPYTLIFAPVGVKFGMDECTSMPNLTPLVQRVAPFGRKTSKLPSE